MNKNSVVVIGLDGATFDLLHPLMDAGMMPNLKRLTERGSSGPLQSTVPPVTGPAWASFQTGTNPGKHGIVDFLRYRPGSYEPALIDSQAIHGQTLWTLLSEHQKRICVVNVPVTYPPQPVHGNLITGFLTPGPDAPFAYPQELREQLLNHIPDYVIAPSVDIVTSGVRRFVENMQHAIDRRWKAARWLIERDSWDLFMVHFQAVDLLQHALWDRLDPAHPDYARRAPSERDMVRQFYWKLDQAIGGLVQLAGDAAIIVMSDHGFGPARKRVYLNQWLVNHGYMGLTASESWMRIQAGLEDTVRSLDVFDLRRRWLPKNFLGRRGRLIRKLTQAPWIDWTNTRAFVFSGSTFSNLYINLAGRDPSGTVPQAKYERLRDELMECFLALADPDTGEPVVDQVHKREEVYTGPMTAELPDLVIRPRGGYLLETRFKGNRLFGPMPQGLTGTHRMDGIGIYSGGPFVAQPQPLAASILDLAPTILHLLGVPVPDWMDGRILEETIHPGYQPPAAQAAVDDRPVTDQAVPTPGYSAEDESEILDRLRGLGYL